MKTSKRITPWRIAALCLANLLPCAVIVFGILMLTKGFIPTLSFLFMAVLLPISALVWNFFLITSKMRTWLKSAICIFLLIIFSFLVMTISALGYFESIRSYKNDKVTEKYSAISNEHLLMPKLDKIAQPESIEYHSYYSTFFIYFTCESETLICKYNEQDYNQQKKFLNEKYIFQQEKPIESGYSCEPVAEIDGYTFRFLSIDEYDLLYPKDLYFIATNDSTHEIVYMSFYDDDLDYITSTVNFINNSCGWKHIR